MSAEQTTTTAELPALGLHDDISNEDYHRGPGISKSGLDQIARSPAYYMTCRQHPRPGTGPMDFGTHLHTLVLEPERFAAEALCMPSDAPPRPTSRQINAKKPSPETVAAIAWWDRFNADTEGKTVISNSPGDDPFWSPGEWDQLHRMRDAIAAHPIASILLDPSQGKAECTCYWVDRDTKRLCRCRPDFWNLDHDLIVDLKTTVDASYTEFGRSVAKWRYHVQDAFYRDGLFTTDARIAGFVFVAVEKSPPYGVGIYSLDDEARRVGRALYERDLRTYSDCLAADEWPAYPAEIRTLEVPAWGLRGHVA